MLSTANMYQICHHSLQLSVTNEYAKYVQAEVSNTCQLLIYYASKYGTQKTTMSV